MSLLNKFKQLFGSEPLQQPELTERVQESDLKIVQQLLLKRVGTNGEYNAVHKKYLELDSKYKAYRGALLARQISDYAERKNQIDAKIRQA